MKANFLLVNGSSDPYWTQELKKALAPIGNLEIEDRDQALRLASQRHYDIIILNEVPTDDLSPLVGQLRDQHQSAKLVVFTQSPNWERARTFLRAGAADYIQRSTENEDLRATFEHLLVDPAESSGSVCNKYEAEGPAMGKAKILFAENNPYYLNSQKELLERDGYFVFPATNPTRARQVLEEERIDLAIIDIGLEGEDDKPEDDKPGDISGLLLAKETAPSLRKIILTQHREVEYVKEALKQDKQGHSAAVNYVLKDEGYEKLLRAVRAALGLREVFVVHGHDEAAKETVARFMEKLGLRTIILHEQPNRGRAIIEKFEEYSNVGFAVVLLTPDDLGRPRNEAGDGRPRARQNVIFELGYFIGKLGRSKVCALYKEGVEVPGVEIPSDYLGVLYLPMDSGGGWRLLLAREMKDAGFQIDLNKAI